MQTMMLPRRCLVLSALPPAMMGYMLLQSPPQMASTLGYADWRVSLKSVASHPQMLKLLLFAISFAAACGLGWGLVPTSMILASIHPSIHLNPSMIQPSIERGDMLTDLLSTWSHAWCFLGVMIYAQIS